MELNINNSTIVNSNISGKADIQNCEISDSQVTIRPRESNVQQGNPNHTWDNRKSINTETSLNIEIMTFPDSQPHVRLSGIERNEFVDVFHSIRSSDDMIVLMMISNALQQMNCAKATLHISYLMGARYDRLMVEGDSIDFEVISRMINQCGFSQVKVLDLHNPIAGYKWLDRYVDVNNDLLVENFVNYVTKSSQNEIHIDPIEVMIIPDTGAVDKSMNTRDKFFRGCLVVMCKKSRDLTTGHITLQVINPEICEGRSVVIVDDLCDGGGTFLAIRDQINPRQATLIVTHGIFSKGISKLEEKFDCIVTTNSFRDNSKLSKKIFQVDANIILKTTKGQ